MALIVVLARGQIIIEVFQLLKSLRHVYNALNSPNILYTSNLVPSMPELDRNMSVLFHVYGHKVRNKCIDVLETRFEVQQNKIACHHAIVLFLFLPCVILLATIVGDFITFDGCRILNSISTIFDDNQEQSG